MASNKFLKDMENEIKTLEHKLANVKFYNMKMYIMRTFIKSGFAAHYAFPYILSLLILINGASYIDKIPFVYDKVSSDLDLDSFSNFSMEISDIDYDVLHSTSWRVNSFGLYERDVTYYKLNDHVFLEDYFNSYINLDDSNEIFSISYEDTITKEILDAEDEMYRRDVFVFSNDESLRIVYDESFLSNFSTTLIYLFFSYIMGCGFKNIGDKTFGTYITDKLNAGENRFRALTPLEVYELERMLELKKENYDMFFEPNNVKGYTYKR